MTRKVLLDANVIEQIGRGNEAAANALKQLRASGAEILVSEQAFDEMVNKPDIPRTATAKKEFLREMGIKTAPAGNAKIYEEVIAKNNVGNGKTILGEADVKTAAQARAIDAEVWSLDRGFRNNGTAVSKKLGVSVADECNLPLAKQGTPEDFRVARRLVGLDEIEIDLNGNVKKGTGSGPKSAAAKAGGSGGSTPTRGGGGGSTGGGTAPTGGGTSGGVAPGGTGTSIPSTGAKIRVKLNAAKVAFKSGVAGAFTASNLASMIPDVILAIADKAALRDALRNIQTKFIKEGFGKGVAAACMGLTQDDVDAEMKNRVSNFRVRGMGDAAGQLSLTHMLQLAEGCENYAVDVGFFYGSTRPYEWVFQLREEGFTTLSKQGWTFKEEWELWEYDFINKFAYVIRHKTDAIVGPAIKFT
ncbi:hypothetical protein ETAA8_07140 [Anatilimnocola aggregata]|uniref:PIN domain-containing protein n=1 Tax=Anatilimnocola aggregata TaxID=2528021 RepID=A0A517Y5Y2_9BACT|nr:PIN domain-containing protein [Anatilimnocola aggregata]QDU25644.1 hypothetical protein ETAA8_07140 [Anatilimnocola aggregata]